MSFFDISRAIHVVEESLSTFEFRGVPIGHTLAMSLFIRAISGERRGTRFAESEFASRLQMGRRWAFPRHGGVDEYEARTGLPLVTWLKDTPRLNGLVEPIIDELGNDGCLVLCGGSSVRSRLCSGLKSILWEDEMPFDLARWRTDFFKWWPTWKKILRAALLDSRLPSVGFWHTAMIAQRQTQRIAACFDLLERIKPSVILTEHDRNENWSCLILVARALGIPTYTLMHGVTEPGANLPFVPVLADKVLCWGNLDLRDLIDAGVLRDRLIAVGNPRLSRHPNVSAAQARSKAGLDILKPVVVLASNSAKNEPKTRFIEQFCVAMRKFPDCTPVVRLHPRDKLGHCEHLVRQYPEVVFLENNAWTLDEAVAAATVVVVHNSGFGSDAVVKGCPIVAFDINPDRPLGHIGKVIEITGYPRARSVEELTCVVRKLLCEDEKGNWFREVSEKFANEFCRAYGEEAAVKIACEILKTTNREDIAKSV